MTGLAAESIPVAVLIAGCGHVAGHGYIPACQALGLPVVAVAEANTRRHAEIVGRLPSAQVAGSVIQAGEVAVNAIPLALNLTPAPAHAAMTMELLEAGWNVLTEKPAAGSAEEWAKLVSVAEERDLALMSAPFTHLSPGVSEIRDWLAGIQGRPGISLEIIREGPAADGFIDHDRQWFFSDHGPLWDLGIYGATVLVGLFGPPSGVTAMAVPRRLSFEVRKDGRNRLDSVTVRDYYIRLEWPEADAAMRVGYQPEPHARNLVARSGALQASASTWDYSLAAVDSSGSPLAVPAKPRESRKYVHGLRHACDLLPRSASLAGHQALVGQVLTLLNQVETISGPAASAGSAGMPEITS